MVTDSANLRTPRLSVVVLIPCLNEVAFIGRCLESLLANDYPMEEVDFLVLDGGSTDGTLELIEKIRQKHSNVRVLHNSKRLKSDGLNLGIQSTQSNVVLRADAHAIYASDYIKILVHDLDRFNAGSTGGVRETYVGGSRIAQAIGLSISHPFAAGDAHYRTGSSVIRETNTLFGGCFRRSLFERIGLFNENLIRAQDREFTNRIVADGGRILLDPAARCIYYPRATFREHWKWTQDGACWLFRSRHLTEVPMLFWRNFVPLALLTAHLAVFIGLLIGWQFSQLPLFAVALYCCALLGISADVARRENDFLLFGPLVIIFAATHFAYGWGSLRGLLSRE